MQTATMKQSVFYIWKVRAQGVAVYNHVVVDYLLANVLVLCIREPMHH